MAPAPIRILVVEDDRDLRGMLGELLRDEGYAVTLSPDGQRGLHEALTSTFDLLILDRGLPAIDGLDLLGRLRAAGRLAPVLILSALGMPSDRVHGLDAGAEDYISKPFDVDELLARLRVLLRRRGAPSTNLPVPGGSFDADSRTATLDDGTTVVLSAREAELLATLAARPGQVHSRGQLLDSVFTDADDEGVVDSYVHHLRRKLGRAVVLTVRNLGYRLGGLG